MNYDLCGDRARIHADLVSRAVAWLQRTRRCSLVLAEPRSWNGECPDAIGWYRYGWSVLVECKTTYKDWHKDFSKPHRRGDKPGMGQERWYLVPDESIVTRLPRGWGLLVAGPSRIRRAVDVAGYTGKDCHARRPPGKLARCAPEMDVLIGAAARALGVHSGR